MHSSKHTEINVNIIKEEGADLPSYASSGASGADVKAFIISPIDIPPSEVRMLPTGLKLSIPHGYELQVRPRSGLALKHGISVLNTPGTIDADYRGEICVLLINHSKETFTVTPGMRIAQLVFAPVVQANFFLTEELVATERGTGGFGHTGTH